MLLCVDNNACNQFEEHGNNLLNITISMCKYLNELYEQFYNGEDMSKYNNKGREFFEKFYNLIYDIMNNIYGTKKRSDRMMHGLLNTCSVDYSKLIKINMAEHMEKHFNPLVILVDKSKSIEKKIENIYEKELKDICIIKYMINRFRDLMLNVVYDMINEVDQENNLNLTIKLIKINDSIQDVIKDCAEKHNLKLHEQIKLKVIQR
jgi:hypothetical protein